MDAVGLASAAANLVTSLALAVAGVAAASMAIVPGKRRQLPPTLAFTLGAGLIFLAADEGLELHDRVGRWLWNEQGVAAPGPINHIDDVILLFYVAVGAVMGVIALPTLLREPALLALLCMSTALLSLGAFVDAFGTTGSWTEVPEEVAEAGGAAGGRDAL